MPPAPPQQGQQDNHMAPIWIILGLFVLIYLIWYFLKVQIYEGFAFIKVAEIDLISLFTNNLVIVKQNIIMMNPETVTFDQMMSYANDVGRYLAPPCAVILIVCAVVLYRKSIGLRFKRIYTMKTLINHENKNWPQSTPILDLDLVNTDIEEGPWAMAQTPMQFAKKHQLLKIQELPPDETMLSRERGLSVTLIKSKSVELFVKQTGSLWRGVDALNIHTKAIFAICAARINDDADAAEKLIRQISASANNKKLDFSGVQALTNKYKDHKAIQRLISHHAYVFTVMPSVLELARTTGVLASADFLWLKLIDRRLWFMLNSVGRQTPVVEVAGPFSHWLVEKALETKVRTPMIDKAVTALEEAIAAVIYTPDEEKE